MTHWWKTSMLRCYPAVLLLSCAYPEMNVVPDVGAGGTTPTCKVNCGSCGDGVCNSTETAASCYQDCGSCGDGVCNGPETDSSCYQDCGSCGDGICNGLETQSTCCEDCGCSTGNSCFSGQCCPTPGAGGTCSLNACGCTSGQVCFPNTKSTGLACFTTSGVGLGVACNSSGACAAGTGCFGGTCKSYCTMDSDCPLVGGARFCQQTTWSTDTTDTIVGVKVCKRVCDPVYPQSPRSPLLSCPSGFVCAPDPAGASGCFKAGTGVAGSSCVNDSGCVSGYLCTTTNSVSTCTKACTSSADCPSSQTCVTFSTPQFAGTYSIGICRASTA